MSPTRIGLLSPPLGNGNLGDEAIVAACIQSIRRLNPGASIYVISPNPGDTRSRHDVETYPIRWMRDPEGNGRVTGPRSIENPGAAAPSAESGITSRVKGFLKRIPWVHRILKGVLSTPKHILAMTHGSGFLIHAWQQLRGTDLLVMAGSGCWCDHFGGAFNFPLTIFEWALLARLAGVPIAVASVGAGPLQARMSRALLGLSLRWATYRSVREVTAQEIFNRLLKNDDTPVLPDLAHGLDIARTDAPVSRGENRLLVGVNPFPHCDPRFWPEGDAARYERYLGSLAEFSVWLVENGHRVLFFPTQIRADWRVIEDLKNLVCSQVGNHSPWLVEPSIESVRDLTSALATTDVVVAGRFHGILLAFRMNRPVIGIGNHHKMSDLMRSMGQARYSLEADYVTRDALIDRFTHLVANRNVIGLEIAGRVAAYRQALERQYEDILDMHPTRTPRSR